jgi:hypothetical protein
MPVHGYIPLHWRLRQREATPVCQTRGPLETPYLNNNNNVWSPIGSPLGGHDALSLHGTGCSRTGAIFLFRVANNPAAAAKRQSPQ